MRKIGFSTGALALADFRKGVDVLRKLKISAVELSALREDEIGPLTEAVDTLDLSSFDYISVHAPSKFSHENEDDIVRNLEVFAKKGWYVIVHPDAIHDGAKWQCLGKFMCIENMDKRKEGGRTVTELGSVFSVFPKARLCFDIGHARQVDPTMTEAHKILATYGDRLVQVHMSEVNSQSKHEAITRASFLAFRKVRSMIPVNVPTIMEADISQTEKGLSGKASREIEKARKIFSKSQSPMMMVSHSRSVKARFSLRTFFAQILASIRLAQ